MKLTQEQYDYIAEYESEFKKALTENYFRIVNRNMLLEYDKIYKYVFKRDSKILNGCNRCVLADIKSLAKVFFEDKAEIEAKKKQEIVENEENTQKESKKADTASKTTKNKKK